MKQEYLKIRYNNLGENSACDCLLFFLYLPCFDSAYFSTSNRILSCKTQSKTARFKVAYQICPRFLQTAQLSQPSLEEPLSPGFLVECCQGQNFKDKFVTSTHFYALLRELSYELQNAHAHFETSYELRV